MLTNYWTLDEALQLIRIIQPETRKYGYHLCLGGGVMNNGKSEKDLDLYFLPLDNGNKPDPDGLQKWLISLWGEPSEIGDQEAYGPPTPPYLVKQKYDFCGLRIDVFILGEKSKESKKPEAPKDTWRDYYQRIAPQAAPGQIIEYNPQAIQIAMEQQRRLNRRFVEGRQWLQAEPMVGEWLGLPRDNPPAPPIPPPNRVVMEGRNPAYWRPVGIGKRAWKKMLGRLRRGE